MTLMPLCVLICTATPINTQTIPQDRDVGVYCVEEHSYELLSLFKDLDKTQFLKLAKSSKYRILESRGAPTDKVLLDKIYQVGHVFTESRYWKLPKAQKHAGDALFVSRAHQLFGPDLLVLGNGFPTKLDGKKRFWAKSLDLLRYDEGPYMWHKPSYVLIALDKNNQFRYVGKDREYYLIDPVILLAHCEEDRILKEDE